MARLIEIENVQQLRSPLSLRTGDVLMVKASGGFVQAGEGVVERLGPFMPGLMQNDQSILSPMGSPGTVMFLARHPGQATVAVVSGDPFFNPEHIGVDIRVDP